MRGEAVEQRTRRMRGGIWLLLVLSCAASGEEAADCSRIEDADERLACFDRQFPKVEETATTSAPEADSVFEPEPEAVPIAAPRQLESESIATPSSVETDPTATVQKQALPVPDLEPDLTEPVSNNKGTLFGGDPKVNLTTTIKAIRRGDKQKMVFLLGNDEIWLQSNPRDLPFEEGGTVTIKNAFFGGYFMRTQKGVSTRVRRIR